MAEFYVLAERLIIPRLQNYIIRSLEELVDTFSESTSTTWINTAYAGTTPGSPLRRFAENVIRYHVSINWFREHGHHFPHEMIFETLAGSILDQDYDGDEFTHRRVRQTYHDEDDPSRLVYNTGEIAIWPDN